MVVGRPSLRYQVLIAPLASLMVITVLIPLSQFWRMSLSWGLITAYCLVAVGVSWLCWRFARFGLLLIPGLSTAAAAATRYMPRWKQYLLTLWQQGQELWEHLRELELATTFGYDLGLLFIVAIAGALSLLIIWESLSRGQLFWSLLSGTIIFGAQWAWLYDDGVNWFILYLTLGFSIWVLGQAARRDASWLASNRPIERRTPVLGALAWVLILAAGATSLPAEFAPADTGPLGEQVRELFPFLNRVRGGLTGGSGSRFSLRPTGFSPTLGLLGGPVLLDNASAFKLSVQEPLTETAYLRGATYKLYTGQTWLPGQVQYQRVPANGLIDSDYSSEVLRREYAYTIAPIIPLGNTLFQLLQPLRVEGLRGGFQADGDTNLWANRAVSPRSSYRLTSELPIYSAEQIRLLSTAKADEKYLEYMQLPRAIPRRVSAMTRMTIAPYSHPYDQAVALESLLKQKAYALDVPGAPPGRDFVDFFLFSLDGGYCVYFATAMTVMLRQAGIPSRLVEGFALSPAAPGTVSNHDLTVYTVTNAMAHAWVEAYFAGYGWVTFDPTPRSDLPAIDRSTQLPRPEPLDPSTDSFDSEDPASEASNPWDSLGIMPEEGLITQSPAAGSWGGLGIGIALTLMGLVGLAYSRLRLQGRIKFQEGRMAVQEGWNLTSGLLHRFGLGPRPHETPMEYAASLGRRVPSLRETAEQVALDYGKARYSAEASHLADPGAGRIRTFWQRAEQALRDQYGWRLYLWHRLKWSRPQEDSAESNKER